MVKVEEGFVGFCLGAKKVDSSGRQDNLVLCRYTTKPHMSVFDTDQDLEDHFRGTHNKEKPTAYVVPQSQLPILKRLTEGK